MVVVIAQFTVKHAHLADFKAKCAELIALSRKEQGCISYKLHQNNAQENHFVFIEHWETQDDLDAHSASTHFTATVPVLISWVEKEPVIQTFSEI